MTRPADEPLEFTPAEMRAGQTAYVRWLRGVGPEPTPGQHAARRAYKAVQHRAARARWKREIARHRTTAGRARLLARTATSVPIVREPGIDRCPRCGAWRWAGTCRTPHEMGRSEVRTVTESGRSVAVGQHDGPGAGNTRAVSHLSDLRGRGQA